MTHQRVSPYEHSCYGRDPEYGVSAPGAGIKLLAFALLAVFVAFTGYENHLTHSNAWNDRWLGLFWLSGTVLLGWALYQAHTFMNAIRGR